ncbi:MAG: Acg family FMN-binding oxidoreductase [Minwuia sp.]|uniref:Acg family FMN-binding oxidoreductase n=1 Tax=Minwuia sp. TaxID=2493630 RepID=UPI003A8A27B2
MISRRRFIRVIGGAGAAGVLVAGGGFWAGTRGAMPESAVAPWRDPGAGLDDPRLKAAAHAMLAPNPHNIQPWQIRLQGDDALTLHVDLARTLPHTDPPGRQILIGQGTFLELYRMAAAELGYRAEMDLLPDGPFPPNRLDGRAVARIRLVRDASAQKDPLFRFAGQRRSIKEPFDTARPVAPSDLEALKSATRNEAILSTTANPQRVQTFRDLTQQALVLEIETPRTLKESIDLMRIGPAEVAANPDGIDLLGPIMWWGPRLGIVSREDIATPGTQSFQVGLDMASDQAQTAMAHAWLVTRDNSRLSQLKAGMDYLRLNLKAAELGVAMHPMSQLLQEYQEMTDLQAKAVAAMGVEAPAHPQMLVRLGHAERPGPSPRRPVDAIIAA